MKLSQDSAVVCYLLCFSEKIGTCQLSLWFFLLVPCFTALHSYTGSRAHQVSMSVDWLVGCSVMECCLTIPISVIDEFFILQHLFNFFNHNLLDVVFESLPEFTFMEDFDDTATTHSWSTIFSMVQWRSTIILLLVFICVQDFSGEL